MIARLYLSAPAAILFLVLMAAGCSREDAVTAATWDPSSVEVTAVEVVRAVPGRLYGSVSASGRIRGRNEALVVAESQGIVQSFEAEPGRRIKRGDVIARLDDTVQRLASEQARSAWENAKLDLEAITSLNEMGNASRTDLLRARSAERGARAAFEQAEKILGNRSIRSPLDGTVAWTEPEASRGNYITPGTQLARIVDTGSFIIYADLGERQSALIAPGAPARVYISNLPELPVSGQVTALAAGLRAETGSYQAIVAFAAPDDLSLKSGMAARVEIETTAEEVTLLVPSSALLTIRGETYLFTAENGIARRRAILPGKSLGDFTQVYQGLEEGALVVISGTRRIADGSPVSAGTVSPRDR